MARKRLALLVVDGYNVIHGGDRYRSLVDDGQVAQVKRVRALSNGSTFTLRLPVRGAMVS